MTPEPLKKEPAELPSDEARLQAVGEAMRKIFAQADPRNRLRQENVPLGITETATTLE